jgi:dual specificity tyrosine-phosphorylation-regulated kinase 2/3/4
LTLARYIQSRFYRAPEVLLEAEYSENIDIWSLGCVVVEMITGWPLFPGKDEQEVLHQIINTIGPPPLGLLLRSKGREKIRGIDLQRCEQAEKMPLYNDLSILLEEYDAKLIDFVKRCLVWEKEKRISADSALMHPWIRGSHNSFAG